MIKSPLRYPGGKSRAIKFITPLISEFKEYREPFVGGGSVFVYLKQKYPNKKFWINDIYENLYLFWKYAAKEPEKLIEQIQYWKNNTANGKNLFKYLLKNINNFNELKKAAAFFVFNRITFSGTTESGGSIYRLVPTRHAPQGGVREGRTGRVEPDLHRGPGRARARTGGV